MRTEKYYPPSEKKFNSLEKAATEVVSKALSLNEKEKRPIIICVVGEDGVGKNEFRKLIFDKTGNDSIMITDYTLHSAWEDGITRWQEASGRTDRPKIIIMKVTQSTNDPTIFESLNHYVQKTNIASTPDIKVAITSNRVSSDKPARNIYNYLIENNQVS